MALINCKVESKLKWTKYCVLSAAAAYYINTNSNNIIFIIKGTKLYLPVVNLSTRDNQNYQNFLAEDFKDQFIGMNIKQKVKMKIQQMNIDIFSNEIWVNRLFVLVYSNQDDNSKKFKTRRYYLSEIIDNYNVTIHGKKFYDQAIDSDIKPYEEITKLTITTGQGEDYTNAIGCFLDYDYIK